MPFAFACLLPRWDCYPPDPAALPPLADWGRAWIGLVPLRPFKNGRWKRVGDLPHFNPDDWPVVPGATSNLDHYDVKAASGSEFTARALCSIETTRDEPTMTVLENLPVEPNAVKDFPSVQVLTQAIASNERYGSILEVSNLDSGIWTWR